MVKFGWAYTVWDQRQTPATDRLVDPGTHRLLPGLPTPVPARPRMVRGHPRLVTVPTGHCGPAECAPTKRKSVKRGRVDQVDIKKRPRAEATMDTARAAIPAGLPDSAQLDSASRPTRVVHFIKKLPGTLTVQLGTGVATPRCRTQNTANRATDGPPLLPDRPCPDIVAPGVANPPGPSDPDRLVPVTERTPKCRTHAPSGHCDPPSWPSPTLSPLTGPRVGRTRSLASKHQGGAGSGPAQERGVSASLRDPMAMTTVVSCRPMRYLPRLRVVGTCVANVPQPVDAGIADPAMIRGPPARPTTTPNGFIPPGTMDHRRSSPYGHERHDNAVHTRKSRANCRRSPSRTPSR